MSIKLKHGVRIYDASEIKNKTITQTTHGYFPENNNLAALGTLLVTNKKNEDNKSVQKSFYLFQSLILLIF